MDVFILGNSPREHAIAKKCLWPHSSNVGNIFYAPSGNRGMDEIATGVNIHLEDFGKLRDFILNNRIELTIVGPEKVLANGVVDFMMRDIDFLRYRFAIFGPSQSAALLESNKYWARTFAVGLDIPMAPGRSFDLAETAIGYLENEPEKIRVIKTSVLTGGKGVNVAHTFNKAVEAIKYLSLTYPMGTIIIEDYLEGWECSYFVLTDGHTVLPFGSAVDYKQAYTSADGTSDGPMTGGMGSYSPVPQISSTLDAKMYSIMVDAIKGMERLGMTYSGVLFGGFMITDQGPRLLEFNCRMGSPEATVVLPRLKTDFAGTLVDACRYRGLQNKTLEWTDKSYVGVVLASSGYPGDFVTGCELNGIADAKRIAYDVYENIKDSGRLCTVVGEGSNLFDARTSAYEAVACLSYDGIYKEKKGSFYYRKDIGL